MLYLSLQGTANRREFIVCTVLNWAIVALLMAVTDRVVFDRSLKSAVAGILVPFIVFAVLEVPVVVRRLRDMGRPVRQGFLLLVPLVNIVFLFVLSVRSGLSPVEQSGQSGLSATEEAREECPECHSQNCAYDKARERADAAVGRLVRRIPGRRYRCFECGHQWEIEVAQ
jgi:uncharacterized membrane protein YhaH (DUF805 family)